MLTRIGILPDREKKTIVKDVKIQKSSRKTQVFKFQRSVIYVNFLINVRIRQNKSYSEGSDSATVKRNYYLCQDLPT